MALSTSFNHTETTLLPLPPAKAGQSVEEIAERGLKIAISLLQNHDFMMDLSPFHLRHEALEASGDTCVEVEKLATNFNVALKDDEGAARVNGGTDWRHYEIHDHLPIMLGMKKEIVFQTALRSTPTGMESLTDPGNSVTIHGRYEVARTKNDPSTLTLVERSATNCNVFLSWYIKANLGSSHADIHKTIKAKFVEEMQKEFASSYSA